MNLSKFPESQRDKLIQLMMVWLNREEINIYDTVHKIYTLDDIEMAMEPGIICFDMFNLFFLSNYV